MMPQILPDPPILDSSGNRANGYLRISASKAFDTDKGHVTTAWSKAKVIDGVAYQGEEPWVIPSTPDGVWMNLEQDLDGEQLVRYQVTVPLKETLTYSELLYNRGGVGGGFTAFWWDLTGDIDFPPEAINGDMGIDTETGDFFRYEA